ncbi:endolytic transglycosylase MltG [Streptomyces sp. NBC_00872]|uniref:endolytic transglycosylase MltG n=2 Tax=unclassified Streptomyces TaxID=2593676 RepID=UPI0038682E36|nr:endolytic transglycosylase MltG [Streptomyces sp. NBC_00872]
MTDYGRGPGSEPWHPEDPLYGDPGWGAQQAGDGQAPYGGQPQQQYPQQHVQPQTQYGDGQDPYQQQYHPQQYGQQQAAQPHVGQQQGGQPHVGQQHVGQHQGGQPQQQPHLGQQAGQPQYAAQQYGGPQQHPQAHHPQQPQHPQQHHPHPQQQQQQQQQHQQQQQQQQHQQPQYNDPQYNGAWDTGQQATMPYAGNPAGPYDGGQDVGYGSNQDYYGTPDAYPPPQPPAQRKAEPEPGSEWEEGQEDESHPFFTGDDDGAEGERDEPGSDRRGGNGRERRGRTKKKSHNGFACLFMSVVLVGGVGGVGYVGFQFLQSKFGAPPDFVGEGSGSVQVEIPQGAGGYEIASILVKSGVVKSQGAFVAAQRQNPKGNSIQAGVYTLSKGMSAAQAVKTMLSPTSHNALIIPEGKRNVWVYEQMDKRLELKKGSTAAVAKAQANNLGLPAWAKGSKDIKDPLEGFLFPASYPVAKGMKPEAILKKMVARAAAEYSKVDLEAEADKLGLKSPLQVITVASLVQAEGKYKHDFDKVARVVYNRLEPDNTETVGRLEFDSTVNYIKAQSRLDLGAVDNLRKLKDPYNTYDIKGLPPGPIGNPGAEALQSALDPTPGPWYYFVSVTEDKTLFAETNEEHERNRAEYEKQSKKESAKR